MLEFHLWRVLAMLLSHSAFSGEAIITELEDEGDQDHDGLYHRLLSRLSSCQCLRCSEDGD